MKKILSESLALALTLVLALTAITAAIPIISSAEELTDGLFTYRISSDTAIVTGCSDPIGNLVIPSDFEGYAVTKITDYAFQNCTGIQSVVIPDSVKNIGHWAFCNCSSIRQLTLGNSVAGIGRYAFSGCSSLKSLILPNSVTGVGDEAFSGCSALSSVTISTGITKISDSMFKGCEGIKSIIIPDNVRTIGVCAFSGCKNLATVSMSKNTITIDENAFKYCEKLNSITIPDMVTTINSGAFSGCISLTGISIPESVTNIGAWAFNGCAGLKDLTLTDSIGKINEGTFYGCTGLTNVSIPDSVTRINDYAFSGCLYLEEITIPDSVTDFGKNIVPVFTKIHCVKDSAAEAYALENGNEIEYITIHSHDYQSIVADEYIKSPADCTQNAVYYKSCICGEKGTETFEYGEALGHNYNAVVTDPTCTEKGYTTHTCARCGDTYTDTETGALGHNWSTSWSFDAANHWHECTECGEKTDIANHIYDNNSDTTCNVCGYTRTVTPPAPQTDTKITVESKRVLVGKEFNVTVDLSNNPGLAYLKLALDYDSSAFELISAANAGLLGGTYTTSRTTEVKPYIIQWMGADNSTGDGNLLTLTFKAKEDAIVGDYIIGLTVVEAYNENYDEVAIAVENGTVKIQNVLIGDFNGDKVINSIDGILCSQALAGWDVEYSELAADVNGDGKFNGKDGILLSQYLAGWDVVLG